MTFPTNSTAPPKVARSDTWRVGGLGALIRAVADIANWITALSPSGVAAYDTGKVAITMASGYAELDTTVNRCTYTREGKTIYIGGLVKPTSGTFAAGTLVKIGQIPLTLEINAQYGTVAVNGTAGAAARVFVSITGEIFVQPAIAAQYVSLCGTVRL